MAATASEGHISGIYVAQFMMRDSDGYPMGDLATPDSPVNGTAYHSYILQGPVSATAPNVTRETAEFRGGMKQRGQRALGISGYGTFDITLSSYDEKLHELITGASGDTTSFGTENYAGADNSQNVDPPQMMLALTAGFQIVGGANQYMTWIYPNVQIAPPQVSLSQDGGTNPNPLTYTVTPTTSLRTAHGYLFSGTTFGVSDDMDIVYKWRTGYQVAFTTYVDDGTATTIATGYRPATADHDGSRNVFTKNGADANAAVSGFSATTGATTHTAGSAGDKWVIAYMTSYVSI